MTNPRIIALPLQLANQIAAGEVIERPASVVKELVENSIDAKATQVDIDIEGAGSQLIRVSDNGVGIHPDDLALALSRHATSKLISSDQLSHINSLGFRGEALPSIASVAHFSLTSRQADSECAWQLSPSEESAKPASHPLGTTIEVRDLFFNLPARRRFLRSNKTEQNQILTTLYRLALSRFDVAFNCQIGSINKLKLPIATNTTQQQQRIAKLCGQSFITKSRYIEQHYDDIQLHGWLGNPEAHKSQTDVQYFFINGRVIRDRVINHAIRLAYGEQIPSGRHPAYVLYLELPLDKVDVNVHPTKHEVRFREARLIHGLITAAIQDGLNQTFTSTETNNETTVQNQLDVDVAEPAKQYQADAKPLQQTTVEPRLSVTPAGLLQQRYLLVQHNDDSLLLDLQQAEKALKQHQFITAISNDSLSTRPLLVPVTISLSDEQHRLFESNKQQLQQFGFDYILNNNQLRLTQIPSLLSQIEIAHLVDQLSRLLKGEESPSASDISDIIPLTPIQSASQAEQLASQLTIPAENNDWCCKLDQQRLTSLFSS